METNKNQPRLPVTRRQFLGFAGVSVFPLLAACSQPATPASPAPAATAAPIEKPAGQTAPPTTAPAPAPAATAATAATPAPAAIKRGGQVIASKNWTYASLDPALISEPEMPGMEAMYNGLVRFQLVDAKTWSFKVVPDLAESFEQPDPKSVVFKLKKGIKFHDGSDFDAEVAKWNILRERDHPKGQQHKAQLQAAVEDVVAVDKSTLRIKLKTESPGFMRLHAFAWGHKVRMLSKVAYDKNGEEWCQRNAVGTGPFRFKQWIADDRVICEKNPDYFENGADGKPLPYLDGVVFRYVTDPTVALNDVRSGTAQMVEWIPTKDVAAVQADANLTLWQMPWAGQIYFYGGYNSKSKPFDDVRVRQAANYAIDREGMAKALGYGVGVPYYWPQWGPGILGYDENHPKYPYDPAKVKQLLQQAGYADGTISIELKIIAREPEQTIGEFMQNSWTQAGIKTKLVALERLAWIDQVRANSFQACFWRGNLASSVVDPSALDNAFKCGSAGNWAQWCNQDVDKYMTEGGSTSDNAKRQAAYSNAYRIIQEQAYVFTGIGVPLLTAYRNELQNQEFDFQSPVFRATWLK